MDQIKEMCIKFDEIIAQGDGIGFNGTEFLARELISALGDWYPSKEEAAQLVNSLIDGIRTEGRSYEYLLQIVVGASKAMSIKEAIKAASRAEEDRRVKMEIDKIILMYVDAEWEYANFRLASNPSTIFDLYGISLESGDGRHNLIDGL